MRIICWNTERKKVSWQYLVDHHTGDDLAILQEACTPPTAAERAFNLGPGPWVIPGAHGARAVVGLSDDVEIRRFSEEPVRKLVPILHERPHSTATAIVEHKGERLLVVSVEMYKDLARYLPEIVTAIRKVTKFNGPAIVAGDVNTPIKPRSQLFQGMADISVPHAGPEGPTYFWRQGHESPDSAHRSYDHVFASPDLADRMTVAALNSPKEWGPSDHCRLVIEIA